jgi:hypothetical protein
VEPQVLPQCLKPKGALHIPPVTATTRLGLCAIRAKSTRSRCERWSQRDLCSGLCSHACTHPSHVTVQQNPSTASSTHHCHTGRALLVHIQNFPAAVGLYYGTAV